MDRFGNPSVRMQRKAAGLKRQLAEHPNKPTLYVFLGLKGE
jgi:cytochrome c-type biogenesis protein CcmH/NrfG